MSHFPQTRGLNLRQQYSMIHVRSCSKIPGRYMKIFHGYFFSYYYGLVVHNKYYFYCSPPYKFADEEAILTEYRRSWYILIIKPTRCTISHIYLIKYSTCFGHVHCPSWVSQHSIHAIGICHASSVGVC